MNSICSFTEDILEVVSLSWNASVDLSLETSASSASRKVDTHLLIAVGLDEELTVLGYKLVPFLLLISIAFLELDLNTGLEVAAKW